MLTTGSTKTSTDKYYFRLPPAAGRLAYLNRWRESVQAELTFSDKALQQVVDKTEDFSFAYLKELCLSAMMAWMAERTTPMDKILRRTAAILRDEMKEKSGSKRKSNEKKARTAAAGRDHWS